MTDLRRRIAIVLSLIAAAILLVAARAAVPPSSALARAAGHTGRVMLTASTPGSSDILSLLPDGDTKRSFILDCTGCHQMDAQRVFMEGRPRTVAEWEDAIQRMLQMAGPTSSFPVISSRVDPAVLAQWLATHLDAVPTAAPRTAGDAATLREYDYPYNTDLPHDLMVDANGRIVITGMFTHRMLLLDPETAQYEEVPIPVQNANPRALDIDDDGRWWVLLGAPGRIARHDPRSREWTTHHIGMYGHSIALDTLGRAWFNGHFTKDPAKIGYVTEAGESRLYDVATPEPLRAGGGPIPYELRVAPDGGVWMSELQGNHIVRLDPLTGESRTWTMPQTLSGPRRFDVDAAGNVWIPAYSANQLVRLEPATSRFTTFDLPMKDAVPYVVRIDRARGRIWIGASAGDAMFSFDLQTERWETFALPTRGALVRHIDVDERTGEVWAAYGASPGIPPRILRVIPQP